MMRCPMSLPGWRRDKEGELGFRILLEELNGGGGFAISLIFHTAVKAHKGFDGAGCESTIPRSNVGHWKVLDGNPHQPKSLVWLPRRWPVKGRP